MTVGGSQYFWAGLHVVAAGQDTSGAEHLIIGGGHVARGGGLIIHNAFIIVHTQA